MKHHTWDTEYIWICDMRIFKSWALFYLWRTLIACWPVWGRLGVWSTHVWAFPRVIWSLGQQPAVCISYSLCFPLFLNLLLSNYSEKCEERKKKEMRTWKKEESEKIKDASFRWWLYFSSTYNRYFFERSSHAFVRVLSGTGILYIWQILTCFYGFESLEEKSEGTNYHYIVRIFYDIIHNYFILSLFIIFSYCLLNISFFSFPIIQFLFYCFLQQMHQLWMIIPFTFPFTQNINFQSLSFSSLSPSCLYAQNIIYWPFPWCAFLHKKNK